MSNACETGHWPGASEVASGMGRLLITLGLAIGLAAPAAATCTTVDPTHAAWTAILARRVTDSQVDYAALKRDDQPAFDAYLATLSGACAADYAKWTNGEKLAFWINAYNAFTVRLVLNHYPVESIRKIGWLPLGAFREPFIPMPGLKGGNVSLNHIEHRTLRGAFREPRTHFALVCAARSCPALRPEAYRGADLDRQLDEQGRAFLGDPAKNRLDTPDRVLYLSSIFDWFREDFAAASGSLWAFVAPYLGVAVTDPPPRIEFLDYDWRLNDRAAPQPKEKKP